jgi:hypothetical protein
MEILPEGLVDTWIGYLGPCRSELFAPLRPQLIARPSLPDGFARSVAPALRLLEEVGRGKVPLDKHQDIKRGVARSLNQDLGFEDPSPLAVEDSVLEVDVLLDLLRITEATDPLGWKETLSHLGRAFMDDPGALWYGLVAGIGLGRPNPLPGDIVETALAWLLLPDDAWELLSSCTNEAAAVREPKVSEERAVDLFQFSIFWTYTHLRALNLFVPVRENPGEHSKPRLNSVGRAGVIEALRAAVATAFCDHHMSSEFRN